VSLLFLGIGLLGSACFEVAIGYVPDGFFLVVAGSGMIALTIAIIKRDALERIFGYSGREKRS